MAIRSWSFTKFWSVSVILWLLAAAVAEAGGYYRGLGLLSAILGFFPAFLAGQWAGDHPEIAHWPRVRLATMWIMVLCAVAAVNDSVRSWTLPLVLLGAPAAIFTLRWYELTSGASRILPPAPPPSVPPTTPPDGSLVP